MHTGCWWEIWNKNNYEKPTHKWKDNIKMEHKQERWEGKNWIHLAEKRDKLKALCTQ